MLMVENYLLSKFYSVTVYINDFFMANVETHATNLNEVKRLTLFKYPLFLVYLVRRKRANPLSLKSACPKLSMSERIEKHGYLPSKLVANIEDITNFIFSCWKYLSLSSEANEWEILSAREDKFVSPSGHVMFCLFYRYWWNSYIKHNFFYYY